MNHKEKINNNFIPSISNNENTPQNNIGNTIPEEKYNIPSPYTNNTSNQQMFPQNYNNPIQNNLYNNYSNNNQNCMMQNTNSRSNKMHWGYFWLGVFVGISIGVFLFKYQLIGF